MSALIATKGKTFDLLFNDRLTLFAPEFLLEEIKKHQETILNKSGLTKEELELVLELISSRIIFHPKEEFKKFIKHVKEISPDPNDIEYFALAQKIKCNIWSNDKKLKEQKEITIYATHELIELL